ncbi:hypothetical protein KAR91_11235 [Candidatus Pacearchaeota archaeon]|nr:hypothetical protein [Candidatus Pacearchaeota archaeon]
MSKAEDAERGVLNVDVNFIKMEQAINNAIYMLEKFKDQLDIAAINKKSEEREQCRLSQKT